MRVRTAFLGGGFGAKLYIKLEAMVAVCALLVRKPVRIALTMDEQFYTITKHGATVRIKTGVKQRRPHDCARGRDLLERRGIRGHRPARHAEVRIHRRRTV